VHRIALQVLSPRLCHVSHFENVQASELLLLLGMGSEHGGLCSVSYPMSLDYKKWDKVYASDSKDEADEDSGSSPSSNGAVSASALRPAHIAACDSGMLSEYGVVSDAGKKPSSC
jgi:hypothetical protein